MNPNLHRARAVAFFAIGLPFGLFSAYVAYLVVPQILRVVVPAAVKAVTAR